MCEIRIFHRKLKSEIVGCCGIWGLEFSSVGQQNFRAEVGVGSWEK